MARVIRGRSRLEVEPIKGSRFVATADQVADEAAARALLADVAAEWPDASHHCWAWRLAEPAIDRAGDDGEPSGSAGRPILAALVGRDLVDTAVVVTRWFGGTKLGVGGLVRAYGGTAAQVVDAAGSNEWIRHVEISFRHGHEDTGVVERVVSQLGAKPVSVEWMAQVERTLSVPYGLVDALWSALADATSGRIEPPKH